jgi:hypothetical protein
VSNFVLADVVTRASYIALIAAVLIFAALLVLTTLHP